MAMRNEPASLAAKPLQNPGGAFYTVRRLFNAELAILDDRGLPRPHLSEALPRLHTDAWRVFPDGRMETTYRLRANLRWHNGTPFSANDFAFAWQVYSNPQLGTASVPPVSLMEQVLAPDERTVAIRWRLPYAEADTLVDNLFPPLPQQILEPSLRDDLPEVIAAHPYWSREFVGLGPYRLDRWEPGAFLEATAFDSFVLGRARISRIKVLFINDSNTALAAVLAGEVQLAADDVLGFQQSIALKREWEPQKAGTVIQHPNQWRSIRFQFRPDVVSPRALLDVRVRKALAYGIDKQSINETI
jgi:peptide/nickel transport system substrate-binding protein